MNRLIPLSPDEDFSTTMRIENTLDYAMVLVSKDVARGIWEIPPPERVHPRSLETFKVRGPKGKSDRFSFLNLLLKSIRFWRC